MIARRLTLTTLASLCALAGLFALASMPAWAVVTHDYVPAISAKLDEGVPAQGPHGESIPLPGPLTLNDASMTVDSGHLWVAEFAPNSNPNSGSLFRIDEFDAATGAFISQLAQGESRYGESGVAVGHLAGGTQVYAGETVGGDSAVAVFDEAGTLEATWTGAGTPGGSLGGIGDVAVDDSTDPLDEGKGDVYVTDYTHHVIDVFHPEADGEEHYIGQITGVSLNEAFSPYKLDVSKANGDVIVGTEATLDILEPRALGEFVLVHKITETSSGPLKELFNVTVDGGTGEIYATEGFNGVVVDQFSATGVYLGQIVGADTPAKEIHNVFSLAVDPETHDVYVGDTGGESREPATLDVFGPNIVLPDVTATQPSNVTAQTATLNGTVDPNNAGEASCRFEWGTSTSFGGVVPCEPERVAEGGSPVPVHAALSGLQPDTTYYYRLQATNQNGTNHGLPSQDLEQFTTPGPGIHGESVTDVASTSATFDATIDPNSAPASYFFQYSTSDTAGCEAAPASCASAPASPGEAIGSAAGDVQIAPRHVQGLLAGTLYHYRVVVLSEPKPGDVETYDGPDATFTTQTAAVSALPDGRHWELVSPSQKLGARIEPITEYGVVQAAAAGNAITYLMGGPIEAEPRGNPNQMQTLSTRGAEGWTSRDITAPHAGATGLDKEYQLFSEDLSLGVLEPVGGFDPQLSAEASGSTPYLTTLNAPCASSCWRPLATAEPGYANVPSGAAVSEGTEFVGASPDLDHIVLRSSGGLTAGAPSKQQELYEWTAGKLQLVSVLPDEEPVSTAQPLLGRGNTSARAAISSDGSRVFWEAGEGSETNLYMRDLARPKTVQLDAAEPACIAEGKCQSGAGRFQIASVDGSKVFFTDQRRLTKASGAAGSADLYECEITETAGEPECKLSDLTPESSGESADVQGGVPGASEDGSYVYFVANGVLAPGASRGTCGSREPGETCNLFVRHDGATRLVVALSGEDSHDWSTALGELATRVSPDGQWLELMAQESLTGYDNHDSVNGRLDAEVYLYGVRTGRLVCASCDPTGARPVGAEYFQLEPGSGGLVGGPRGVWDSSAWVAANVPGWIKNEVGRAAQHQPRYLSDGGRLFFNSDDALVPQDVNGTEDVYEYEPPGVGDCTEASATFDERAGGCVGLISAGTSSYESAFLDAGEGGGDVFILTFSRLATQDYDNSMDVYDAHECTSSSSCFATAVPHPPPCTTADACRAAPTPQPAAFGVPASATFSGAGNIVPENSGGTATVKSLTRAQRLASALKMCKKRYRSRAGLRKSCEKRAEARYGPARPGSSARKTKGNR
jgi:hypothetical protein